MLCDVRVGVGAARVERVGIRQTSVGLGDFVLRADRGDADDYEQSRPEREAGRRGLTEFP